MAVLARIVLGGHVFPASEKGDDCNPAGSGGWKLDRAAGMIRRMRGRRRAVRPVSRVAAVITLLLLSGCGSSSANGGSGAATTSAATAPTAAPQPPATTPAAAGGIVQQWAAAANRADVHLVMPQLPPIEEGPALEMDTAQFQADATYLKTIQPFTVTDVTTVVPANGAYPTSFLAETTFRSSSGVTRYLLVFAKDDAGSPWKMAAYLAVPGGASFPSFALNAQGYGTALDATTMPGYAATVPGVAGAYCNYLGTIFGTTKQVPNAPNLSFAPGQNTSDYVSSGKSSTDAIRHAGGTSDGTYAPETYGWAYKLADGSALDIVTIQSTLNQSAAANTQISVPSIFPFVTAGKYSNTTQASEGTFGIVEPATGTTVSVTLQYIQYTKAQAT